MEQSRLTGRPESLNVSYLRKSVLVYLSGEEDWKFVVAIIRESGLGKQEALDVLKPLKGQGWKSRSQALFSWLEHQQHTS
jgi:hypothetical protein